MSEPGLYFKQLELGPMQNFIYLLGDPKAHEAIVIDASWDIPRILHVLRDDGYQLTGAFATHHHFDHVMGLGKLLKDAEVPVYVHEADAPHVHVPQSNVRPLKGGETIQVGAVPVSILHTPGHTPGSQCLLVNGRLFSGDTLFIKACGRCDLPGGNAAQLYESLSKLRALDDETVLYPGHNYAEVPCARLGDEKRENPFLASPNLAQFLRLVGAG